MGADAGEQFVGQQHVGDQDVDVARGLLAEPLEHRPDGLGDHVGGVVLAGHVVPGRRDAEQGHVGERVDGGVLVLEELRTDDVLGQIAPEVDYSQGVAWWFPSLSEPVQPVLDRAGGRGGVFFEDGEVVAGGGLGGGRGAPRRPAVRPWCVGRRLCRDQQEGAASSSAAQPSNRPR
ncbi:hypothetical protein NKH77_53955 [Streptomyces sp. M19]